MKQFNTLLLGDKSQAQIQGATLEIILLLDYARIGAQHQIENKTGNLNRHQQVIDECTAHHDELMEMIWAEVAKYPKVDPAKCSHRYSRSMKQEYPRRCLFCNDPELYSLKITELR